MSHEWERKNVKSCRLNDKHISEACVSVIDCDQRKSEDYDKRLVPYDTRG